MRQSFAFAGLVLSSAGVVVFLALGIGAWVAKREADRQLESAAVKAHQAGDVAERVIALVREVIARARQSLSLARADTQPTPGPPKDPFVNLAMWKAKRELPGEVEKARDAVNVASEAVIVAESLLDVFIEHKPEETALGVRTDDIHAARTQLVSAATDLRNARTVLGVPVSGGTEAQYTQTDQALAAASGVTDRVDAALKEAQVKVDAMKASANRWTLRLALVASGLAAWAALGQVFLFRASRRALRGSAPCSPSP